jgi:predicted amidophosphoribosyltransferase
MNEQKFCSDCGAANSTRAAFCANCGKTFTSASTSPPSSAPQPYTSARTSGFHANFKFCKNCGRKVSLNGQLCARCGADLGAPGEQNVPRDAVRGEVVVGYTSHVLRGSLGVANGVLLFTTDRTVMAKASGGFAAEKSV